jgi:hypothetical protein
MSADEKKFVAFWTIIFASAIAFWAVAVHWLVGVVS